VTTGGVTTGGTTTLAAAIAEVGRAFASVPPPVFVALTIASIVEPASAAVSV
jgi:hypothetical protein